MESIATNAPAQLSDRPIHPSVARIIVAATELQRMHLLDEDDAAKLVRIEPVRPRGTVTPAGRNEACPCGRGKKFKRCCRKV
jgi:uncharacterized protein YecA (UPF0149 family)